MKGGKREGAGRPVSTAPAPTIQTAIRLSPAHLAKFKELGGVRWIRRLLDEAKAKPK